jgi:hypothetical protein
MMGEPKIPAKRDPIMPEGYDGVTRRKSREAPPFRTWEEFTPFHEDAEQGSKESETFTKIPAGCPRLQRGVVDLQI